MEKKDRDTRWKKKGVVAIVKRKENGKSGPLRSKRKGGGSRGGRKLKEKKNLWLV